MKNNPLIIVFYVEREYMRNTTMMTDYVEDINNKLVNKNTIAFFLPTDGESRIECINPVIVKEADMEKINNIIEDIKTNFSVASEMELPIEEVDVEVVSKEENND
jgi:tetrahydromethanopterin S-methyltransferase subunit F